ncbi:hypothetical protein Pla52n_53810 [Stieleria varia]|uniref:FAD-binding domain-containing protein n=1 Tax=Stieleria varia TaxID=2528005 RepID=A0A5C6A5B1_9BACT|nr:hypothetical protein Pla52n_53810 [Stieleria varia]
MLLVDKSEFPRRKVCGCYLNGSALATLRSVGLGELTASLNAPSVDRVRMGSQGRTAELSLPRGAAISREVLDSELVRHAISAGAEFLSGASVRVGALGEQERLFEVSHAEGKCGGRAKVIIVADGVSGHSLRECTDIQFSFAPHSLIGTAAMTDTLPDGYRKGTIHMAIGKSGYVGALQLQDGRLDVAGAFDPDEIKRSSVGEVAQAISDGSGLPQLRGLASLDWRGTPPLSRTPSRPAAQRLFLVGDAAGYVEPFTGEGMSWALASGRSVVPCVAEALDGKVDEAQLRWVREHRRLLQSRQRACRWLTRGLRRPVLVGAAISLLSRMPSLASPVVSWINRSPSLEAS